MTEARDVRAGGAWREVLWLFLRMGATAFGGPAAHIALMQEECVRVRGWVTAGEFADLLSAANLLPGPSSTELAMMLGLRRAGIAGLLAAGVAFIGPAVILVWVLAWGYVRYGSRLDLSLVLSGMQPIVLAVVLLAVVRLGRTVLRSGAMLLCCAASVVAALAGVHELLILLVAAFSMLWRPGVRTSAVAMLPVPRVLPTWLDAVAAPMAVGMATVGGIFGTFFKLGCIIFGSGYVIVAFMRAEFVERNHWLTDAQLLDAIAVGQITPGPVFSTATFIGFLLAGHAGAAAATLGMFLPSFVLSAVSGPVVAKLRASTHAAAALDGLNSASLALMAVVALVMARGVVSSIDGGLLLVVAFALLLSDRVGTGWVLLAGLLIGTLRAVGATLP